MTKRIMASALALVLTLPLIMVQANEPGTPAEVDVTEEVTLAPDEETTETPENGEVPTEEVLVEEVPAEDIANTEEPAIEITPISAPITVEPFEDVTVDAWFAEDVKYVFEKGIMNGATETTFEPNTQMTRGMVVTVLARSSGAQLDEEIAEDVAAFEDVAETDYFAKSVYWAQEKGVVNGVSETSFAPNASITREDFAVILYRYIQNEEITLPSTRQIVEFSDDSGISEYAKEALYAMYYAGIINGGENLTVNPQGLATRAEVAAMLHRFTEKAGL